MAEGALQVGKLGMLGTLDNKIILGMVWEGGLKGRVFEGCVWIGLVKNG
jgi:hypothetical protein